MSHLIYEVCFIRYQAPLYLWQFRLVLKQSEVKKFYGKPYLKTFWLIATLPMKIQVSGKSNHFTEIRHSEKNDKKLLIKKVK